MDSPTLAATATEIAHLWCEYSLSLHTLPRKLVCAQAEAQKEAVVGVEVEPRAKQTYGQRASPFVDVVALIEKHWCKENMKKTFS